MHTYSIILISALISTANIPIYKFQYQRMFDQCVDNHLPDHYANMGIAGKHQWMFDHCADHHLPDHYANTGTAVKVVRSLMHNVVISIQLILKCAEFQKKPLCKMHMSLYLPLYC